MKIVLSIVGMHCAACAVNIEKTLKKQKGVMVVNVNYAVGQALVEFDEQIIGLDEIKKIIASVGDYRAVDNEPISAAGGHAHHQDESTQKAKRRLRWSIILSLIILPSMFWPFKFGYVVAGADLGRWLLAVLSFIVVFIAGWQFHRIMWQQLKRFQSNMDTLISPRRAGAQIRQRLLCLFRRTRSEQRARSGPGPRRAPDNAYEGPSAASAVAGDLQPRLVFAMVNEAARVLEEQVVPQAWMVDLAVSGTGFAPFRGGPLRLVDQYGPDLVVEHLNSLERACGTRSPAVNVESGGRAWRSLLPELEREPIAIGAR